MALDAHLVAKLLCQYSKLTALVNICLGLVDDTIPVGVPCIIELLGTVLILLVALGNHVRPLVRPGRQALQNDHEHVLLLRVDVVVLDALLKCNLCFCHPSFHS